MVGVLVLLAAFLVGGTLLILLFGAQIEDLGERDEQTGAAAGAVPRARRLAFARPSASASGEPEDAWFSEVQAYLEAEQMVADEFVLQPSMERLYREPGERAVDR
jgi:hypothetical protein